MTLEEIGRARGSTYKPFPPKNNYFEFDFTSAHPPTPEGILSAVRQNSEVMLNPPISNFGVKGIRRTAKEITRWPERFDDMDLRANLFMFYIMSEIGGTGGGMFRPMYWPFPGRGGKYNKKRSLGPGCAAHLRIRQANYPGGSAVRTCSG